MHRYFFAGDILQYKLGVTLSGAGWSKGRQARAEQLGHDGYVEMGKKGGSATNEQSGGDAAAAFGHDIEESKFTN